jgi:uncharacterized membrane protein YqgA involved in biofilm formation
MGVDVWIDVILIAVICVIVGQNFGLNERLKRIEAKLDRS